MFQLNRKTLTYCFLLIVSLPVYSQNVGINSDGATPESGTMLDIKSSGATSATFGLKVKDSGGNNHFTVRSDGNVGIGFAAPTVHLGFSPVVGQKIRLYDSGGVNDTYGFGVESSELRIATSTNGKVTFHNGYSGTENVVINNVGNVGINESSPSYKMDIKGFEALRLSDASTDATDKNLAIHGRHYTNSEESILYLWGISNSTASTLRIGSSHPSYNSPTLLQFVTAPNTTTLGGSIRMVVNSAGNVGIGTTTPQNILDVEGGTAIGSSYSGSLTAPTDGLLVEGDVAVGQATSLKAGFHYKRDTTHMSRFMRLSNTSSAVGSGSSGPGPVITFQGNTDPAGGNDLLYTGILNSGFSQWGALQPNTAVFVAHNGVSNGINIGTIDVADVKFWTDQNERMLIDGGGNIGIGTSTPTDELQVVDQTNSSNPVNIRVGDRTSIGQTDISGTSQAPFGSLFGNNVSADTEGNGYYVQTLSGSLYGYRAITMSGNNGAGTRGIDFYAVAGATTAGTAISTANIRMRITDAGNVGIGTITPGYTLQVGNAGDGTEARANAWNNLSDRRLKENFSPIDNALEKVQSLDGVYFDWKSTGKKSIGFIAQDVEKVLPEIISRGTTDKYLSMEYGNITAVLVEAIKEQQKTIENLNNQLEVNNQHFNSELNELKSLINNLMESSYNVR